MEYFAPATRRVLNMMMPRVSTRKSFNDMNKHRWRVLTACVFLIGLSWTFFRGMSPSLVPPRLAEDTIKSQSLTEVAEKPQRLAKDTKKLQNLAEDTIKSQSLTEDTEKSHSLAKDTKKSQSLAEGIISQSMIKDTKISQRSTENVISHDSTQPAKIEEATTDTPSTTKRGRYFSADVEFSVDIPQLCTGNVTLVIAIYALAHQKETRDIIRQTWLSPLRDGGQFKDVRYFFLLGRPINKEVRGNVTQEAAQYGDIVVAEFEETYENLPIKSVVAMIWISSRCGNAKYFMKTDDDVWVHLNTLMSVTLQNKYKNQLTHKLGGVCRRVAANRNKRNKWYVTKEEFPGDMFDPYCAGPGYIGGIAIAKGVARVYKQVPYLRLEDVYIGQCLKALGYSTIFLPRFENLGSPNIRNCRIKNGDFAILHKIPAERMLTIHRSKCKN